MHIHILSGGSTLLLFIITKDKICNKNKQGPVKMNSVIYWQRDILQLIPSFDLFRSLVV